MCVYLHPLSSSVLLKWTGLVSIWKQQEEDWVSQMWWPRATEDIITLAEKDGPQVEFHQGGPPYLWCVGGSQLTCCPAVRSGIKQQVDRGSFLWLEWGGNKCADGRPAEQQSDFLSNREKIVSDKCHDLVFCNSENVLLPFLTYESIFLSIIHSYTLPWAHAEIEFGTFSFKGNCWDIFGASLWQKNLMHGHWQQHQQYLHTGIGPFSEVTHRLWIMLPCSVALWSRGWQFDRSSMWSLSLSSAHAPPIPITTHSNHRTGHVRSGK